jgi:hypothetical protein
MSAATTADRPAWDHQDHELRLQFPCGSEVMLPTGLAEAGCAWRSPMA